jgi:hypothetical protein
MGEFQRSDASGVPAGASGPDCGFPADFGPDEIEFATALRALFSPEREELPPLYVQTLTGDGRCPPIEASFEQKVTYQVFRRLGLERRGLFEPLRGPAGDQRPQVWAPVRRLGRVGGVVAACAAVLMIVSVVLASPSFAAGVRILLSHTGVQPVASYPAGVLPSTSVKQHGRDSVPSTPLSQVDWLGSAAAGYVYQNTRLDSATGWSDGPIVELIYQRPGNTPGSGMLDVREFRLSPAYAGVLQTVEYHSATAVTVGDQPGVYVDGRWVHAGQRGYVWEYGVKSELIFERDGLIFWIVADQRDGTAQNQLIAIAGQLQSTPLKALAPNRLTLRLISLDLEGTLQSPINDEVYFLVPAGSSLESGEGEFVSVQQQTAPMQ